MFERMTIIFEKNYGQSKVKNDRKARIDTKEVILSDEIRKEMSYELLPPIKTIDLLSTTNAIEAIQEKR